jgi:uncharacterized coiled-coil protein SlyX
MIILTIAVAILLAVVIVQHFRISRLVKELNDCDATIDDLLESTEIEFAEKEAVIVSLQNYVTSLEADAKNVQFELQSLKEIMIAKTPEVKAPKAPKAKQAPAPVAPAKKKKATKKSV